MPLQIFFGEDEHTAKDGPYNRVLKTRKWLYLGAAAGSLVAAGLYDEGAAKALLRVVALPEDVIRPFLLLGLVYLLVQYVMLAVQLGVVYDLVLSERLAFRREDDLSAGRQKVQDAQKALNEYSDQRPRVNVADIVKARAKVAEIEAHLVDLQQSSPEQSDSLRRDADTITYQTVQRMNAESRLREAKASLNDLLSIQAARDEALKEPDPVKLSLTASLSEASAMLIKLQNEDPARRSGYKVIEIMIDVLRVCPPVAFAASVIVALLLTV